MSKGRSINAGNLAADGTGVLQGFRVAIAVLTTMGGLYVLLRWGFPRKFDGRAIGALVLVSIAAISTVGYVYRRWPERFGAVHRLARRFDPNRRLRLTRDGKILVGITLAVGAAAVNTGNNFLYLVLGLLLALVSVSGVLSEWVLRELRVCLEPGGERFAGLPGTAAFYVFNQKARLSSMSVEVVPLVMPPGAPIGSSPVRLPARFFMRLLPGSRERGVVRAELPQRGTWRLLGFEVATNYPFGFFRKWKHEVPEGEEPAELLVFPRPVPVPEQLRRIRMMVGERSGERAGRGDEFFSLRHHHPQDDVRRIAWKRSARTGRLMVREDEEPRGRMVTLIVPGGVMEPTDAQREQFEEACRVAAGLVLALLERGDEVGLVAGAQVVAPSRGPAGREALFTALALAHINDETATLPDASRHGAVVMLEGPGRAESARVHVRVPVRTMTVDGRRAA